MITSLPIPSAYRSNMEKDSAIRPSGRVCVAHATDEFAARRMDRSIRAALSGRRVEDLAGAVVPAK